jgi:hypothetical protein
MYFNKVAAILEIILIFSFSIYLFHYNPLWAIIFLVVYSLVRNTYYLLFVFTFLYDLLFSNLYFGLPKVSIVVCVIAFGLHFLTRKIFTNIRKPIGIEYDF